MKSRYRASALAVTLLVGTAAASDPKISELREVPIAGDALGEYEWNDRWNVVGYEDDDRNLQDAIRDSPHTDEDTVTSVRFATGKIDGEGASLMITAQRHWRESIPDPAPTTIAIYKLAEDEVGVGTTPQLFQPVKTIKTSLQYCNADYALRHELALPVPTNYDSLDKVTGCLPPRRQNPGIDFSPARPR